MIVLNISDSFDNPFLPKLKGVSPDSPFGDVKIDFGNSTYSDVSWQKIVSEAGISDEVTVPISPQPLLNSLGLDTNLIFSSSAGWRWGASGPETSLDFPDNLGSDYLYIGDNSYGKVEEADFYIDGLSKKRLYSLEIFAARETSSDVRIGYYTANGISGTLDAADNISNTLLLENIAADENGRITLNIRTLDSDFAYINALILRDN